MNTASPQNGVSKREKHGGTAALSRSDGGGGDGGSTPPHPAGPSSHWTLMVVFFSLLVDLLGFTVILPLIPSMLEYYSKNDKVNRYGLAMLTVKRVVARSLRS